MVKQIISEEFRRMQKLAGLLKEEEELTFKDVTANVPPALEKLGYKDNSEDDSRGFMFEYKKEIPSEDLNGVIETAYFRVLVSLLGDLNTDKITNVISRRGFIPDEIFTEVYFIYDDEIIKRIGREVYGLKKFSNIQQLTNEILNLVKEGEDMVYKALDFGDDDMIEKDMAS
jgi:hypothetical protein